MKLSVKFQEDQNHIQSPLVTAKIPISILNHPFLTSISTTISDSSHLSLSLSSNFPSGPSLKLSYSPTISTPSPPFSLCLKSGLGLFGSPNHSPLIFTAHFSLSSINPTFSLLFTPQFGNISFKKATFSNPNNNNNNNNKPRIEVNPAPGSASNLETGNGFVPEGSSIWQELRLEPLGGKDGDFKQGFGNGYEYEKDGFLSGIAVMARTMIPVTKRVKMNMRWGVNLPSDLGSKMPYLKLNKIGIESVEEGKEEEEEEKKKKKKKSDEGDLELLKGMCLWMSRDLEVLERQNREMKQNLEQMKFGVSSGSGGKYLPASKIPSGESSGEFERWRSNKNVKEENEKREPKKKLANQAPVSNNLESELERAIKAAAAAAAAST